MSKSTHTARTPGPPTPKDLPGEMHAFLTELFPICRSITGDGLRQTLNAIKKHIPLQLYEIPTGTRAFDWTVPKEWTINAAFIEDETGHRIVDFERNNLHVVGYSVPVDQWLSLSELEDHLHSLEAQPNAIPYVTSYYQEGWGFCIAHNERVRLKEGRYRAYIDSELKDGYLTYGEYVIQGSSNKEVFLSTYVCHPSLANNELSGPVVLTFLAKWIVTTRRKYTYRIVFVPETIGSLVYLCRNLDSLKNNVEVGFNISCVGDERAFSRVASRYGNTFADRIADNVLQSQHADFRRYSFLDRGSDERQYCSPGVDLPVVSLCRSKYGTYPEYHTSLDDLEFVTGEGLRGGYEMVQACIELAESNARYRATFRGEPQLGKRGLYPTISHKHSAQATKPIMDFLAYADGSNDLINISDLIGIPALELAPIAQQLLTHGLIEPVA